MSQSRSRRTIRGAAALSALAVTAVGLGAVPSVASVPPGGSPSDEQCATVDSVRRAAGVTDRTHRSQGSSSRSGKKLSVASGETVVVAKTTRFNRLTIDDGGTLAAPEGYQLTLTVNGVETGQTVSETGGTNSVFAPGSYRGNLVLSVAEDNVVEFSGLSHLFRQALYVGTDGVDEDKSVFAAVSGGRVSDDVAKNVAIRSTGELFNGIYVIDRDYTIENPTIALDGNGRSDFAGQGAGIIGTGDDTRLVVDGARIANRGVVRPAVIADDGANVIVKDSQIATEDGTLPDDYQSNVNLAYMQDAPWMLGVSGNNRATNVLGENTTATYISSKISSENWGALSVDTGTDMKLSAINSVVCNTGEDGYGTYVIGNADEQFLGTTFKVATYATIMTGGSVAYGDSSAEAVSDLNDELDLGLTSDETRKLEERATTIESDRFGVMWHNQGAVDISGATQVNTGEATFLNKGQTTDITVDGSLGAQLNPSNGVLMQMMENDDPGPQPPDMHNTGVYTEPTTAPTKDTSFDVTQAHDGDAAATFTYIALEGDFFNAMRGDGRGGAKNMVLTFDASTISGRLTASTAKHRIDTITSADYRELGTVTNTPESVVNNGVVVSLTDGSTWTVTGTSYLSSLTVGADSAVEAPNGKSVEMTVDGVETPIVAGQSYTGDIVISVD